MLEELKYRLREVRFPAIAARRADVDFDLQALKDAVREPEDSSSE